MSGRLRVVLLATSLLLSCFAATGLVFQPSGASAGVTPGVAPDFVAEPGDTKTETFDNALVGSVEARSNPDDCRNDAALGLTCAAHRIKLNGRPGTPLTIVLEWDAQAADVASVPDVDMFLFDAPTAKFDSSEVGGAGQTMPEQIDIVPTQDEYDLVVQAWAGVVSGYKITVYYGVPVSGGGGGSGDGETITPDIVLSPDQPPFIKEYTTAIATPPGLAFFPSGCRDNPQQDAVCDIYRIKLNRNKAKDALNFVVLKLTWDAADVPALGAGVTTLTLGYVPDLDVFLYDTPEHSFSDAAVGGQGLDMPEQLGWPATQDEYDIVIQSQGPATGYTIEAFMTDEIFDKPFELLDPTTGLPIAPGPGDSQVFDPSRFEDVSGVPSLGLAPIENDSQIAGIGLGTTEQFDVEEAVRLGRAALRNTAASSEPPAVWVLVLALVVVPSALLGVGVGVARRRRNVLF